MRMAQFPKFSSRKKILPDTAFHLKQIMAYRILIVEDEILIGDTISRYLHKRQYEVVGIAISFEEAVDIYERELPDLVLLDIRLSGPLTGIDVARFILEHEHSVPFIFLTSQTDSHHIQEAKATFPAGYLSKPIQIGSLFATIEISMHSRKDLVKETDDTTVQLSDGKKNSIVAIQDILFLQADHVYVHVYIDSQTPLMPRNSLTEILDQLPPQQFFQTHRSYAVNLRHISHWDKTHVFIGDHAIPVSRSRRKILMNMLGDDGENG